MASNKAKKIKLINKKTMIATIDIGKNIHYGYFRAPDGHELKPFSFYNSPKVITGFGAKSVNLKDNISWKILLLVLNLLGLTLSRFIII